MSAIVGNKFANTATDLGLSVCLHKFCDINTSLIDYSSIANKKNVFVSVGLNDWERVDKLSKASAVNWLIDCANGYLPQIKDSINRLTNYYPVKRLIVGNVMSSEGIYLYNDVPKYNFIEELIIRVGIAGGAACATSDVTGFNRGQITEILECSESSKPFGIHIAADGGVKNGNYAAKAFGAGANYVMMGRYFANAEEANTWVTGDGTYWGGASIKQQQLYGGVKRHSEGKVVELDANAVKPLKQLVDDLWGGLSSSVSYSGYKSLSEFIGNGVFEIKENSLPPGK